MTYLHYLGVDLGQAQDPTALCVVTEPLHVEWEWARALSLPPVPDDGWLWDVGALTEHQFRSALEAAGFEQIEIRETHRVHEHATAAIIRARKPAD